MNDDHNVFLGWSGVRSEWVADKFRKWLPVVLQGVKPWMSPEIDKGVKGQEIISQKLNSVKIGIVCLTPENQKEPWILFEAGALSKAVGEPTYVCPYPIGGLETADVELPLGGFQHTSPDEKDTFRLINTINSALGPNPVPNDILERAFEGWWPRFEKEIAGLPAVGAVDAFRRSSEDILSEVLETTRAQANLARAMQTQLTHVETILDRTSFADTGMIYSSALNPGKLTTLRNLSGLVTLDEALAAPHPESRVSLDRSVSGLRRKNNDGKIE
jgi:hypothetical protein